MHVAVGVGKRVENTTVVGQQVILTRRKHVPHDSTVERREPMLLDEPVLHGEHVIVELRKVRAVQ